MAYNRNKRDSGSRGGFGGRNFRDRDSDDSDDRGFGRNKRFGGSSRGGFGGQRSGGRDSDRRPVEMHKTVCDSCGKSCEVPFKPTSGKPVYCSECFEKKGSSGNKEGSASGMSTNQYNILNAKLDKIMHALKIVSGKESSKDEEESDDDDDDDDDDEEDEEDEED